MAEIDHVAVAAASLEDGRAWVEALLGTSLSAIGQHAYMGTHNRLLGLGPGLYLEVIAIDPAAPRPAVPRWFDLDRFTGPPRITNWIVRTGDLDAALAAAPAGAGRATALARGDFRWRIGIPETGVLPFGDTFPALIEWEGAAHPADRLPDQGIRLTALEISTPDPAALAAALPGINDDRLWIVPGVEAIRACLTTPGGEVWL
ncbi:MAG: VOC family protein [Paracoccaceae bacterium]